MLNDLKFALRSLKQAPGFAIAALLTVAVAIGANTAILSFADAVLFRPLPYQNPERLALLMLGDRQSGRNGTLVQSDYLAALTAQHSTMSAPATFESGPALRIEGPDGVDAIGTVLTTPNYFEILGVTAVAGRIYTSADAAGVGQTALLSHASWRRRFGGNHAIIGSAITLGGKRLNIVGVLPPDFAVPAAPSQSLRRAEVFTVAAQEPPSSRSGFFYPVVRLAPGVTRDRAQAELDAIGAAIGATDSRRVHSRPVLVDIRETMFRFGTPVIRLLLVAAILVLLLGAANLANMMLARSRGRERELAVRASLGASRFQLLRPVLAEAILVGTAGSGLGIVANAVFFNALANAVPRAAFGNVVVGVDARVVATAAIMGAVASLIFAALPAWRASCADAQRLLRERSASSTSRLGMIGRPMVAVQVALAMVLIFGAAVTTRAFVSILRLPLGFDANNVATVDFTLPAGLTDLPGFYRSVIAAIAARPDVESVGATNSIPMSGFTAYEGATRADGRPGDIGVIHVFPGFFAALRIPVVSGRALAAADFGGDAMVISQSAAREMFGGEEPIGRSLTNGRGRTWTVVGVAADVRQSVEADRRRPDSYVLPADRTSFHSIVVRVRQRQASVLQDLKRTVQPLAPGQVIEVAWWDDSIMATQSYKNPRFQTMVLTSFAAIALGLTALGLFGLVSFLVASRTRELGIRLAIGASPRSLVLLTVRQMLWPVAIGLVGGLLATRLLAKLAEAQLFKVDTRDPATLAVASAVVVISAMIAAYLPARRAERIDPISALRTE